MKNKSLIALTVVMALLITASAVQAANGPDAGTIAVAASGGEADARISERSSRTPYLLIFDGRGNLLEVHENPITRDRQAGPAMAEWLSDKGVDTFIGGGIGRNLGRGLERHQISGIEADGSASDAVNAVLERND